MPKPKDEWKLRGNKEVPCFQFEDFPELLYLIKTGTPDMYIVVHEDAYGLRTGETEIHTAESFYEKYNLKAD